MNEENVREEKKRKSPVLLIVIIVLAILILLGGGAALAVYFVGKSAVNNLKSEIQTTAVEDSQSPSSDLCVFGAADQEDAMLVAKNFALGMSSTEISDIEITEPIFYCQEDGTYWVRYTAVPVPETAADPATGVMKKVQGGEWQSVNFGTADVESGLPSDVIIGLELNVMD